MSTSRMMTGYRRPILGRFSSSDKVNRHRSPQDQEELGTPTGRPGGIPTASCSLPTVWRCPDRNSFAPASPIIANLMRKLGSFGLYDRQGPGIARVGATGGIRQRLDGRLAG